MYRGSLPSSDVDAAGLTERTRKRRHAHHWGDGNLRPAHAVEILGRAPNPPLKPDSPARIRSQRTGHRRFPRATVRPRIWRQRQVPDPGGLFAPAVLDPPVVLGV